MKTTSHLTKFLPACPTSEDWEFYLSDLGVPFKFGLSRCHWNVLPVSNFKPWTPEQCDILENAVTTAGYKFSLNLVKMVGSYFETHTVVRGKGMKII